MRKQKGIVVPEIWRMRYSMKGVRNKKELYLVMCNGSNKIVKMFTAVGHEAAERTFRRLGYRRNEETLLCQVKEG